MAYYKYSTYVNQYNGDMFDKTHSPGDAVIFPVFIGAKDAVKKFPTTQVFLCHHKITTSTNLAKAQLSGNSLFGQ